MLKRKIAFQHLSHLFMTALRSELMHYSIYRATCSRLNKTPDSCSLAVSRDSLGRGRCGWVNRR